MLYSLILTFCSLTTCEEYVIDQQLTVADCKGAMMVERKIIEGLDDKEAYRTYMELYQAEKMLDADSGVAWELSCTTDERL